MSGGFRPSGGQDPYEGDDLDGLLSGNSDDFPEGLQQVAQTLDALRFAPMPAELGGEAAARAAFREMVPPGRSVPARTAGGSGGSRTLILSTGAAEGGRRAASGRHRRRPLRQRGGWQPKAVVAAAAAAVVVVGAAALASRISGSGARPVAAEHVSATATASTHAKATGSNAVQGSGTPEPTPKPTPTASTGRATASSADLCHEYFDSIGRLGPGATKTDAFKQLSVRAGGPGAVWWYCMQLSQVWDMPQRPGYPMSGDFQGQQGFQGSQGSQGEDRDPGSGGNGDSQGGNGPEGRN